MPRKKILCVVGTRPEAIKMAPIILRLREESDRFETRVLATAQHRELLDNVLRIFGIEPDEDLNIMTDNQTLADVTCRVLGAVTRIIQEWWPDEVLAQGDTTTVMATAMACFFNKTSFGHVEAGLRTWNLEAPYPEEFNRRVAALATRHHFAPTGHARENLIKEGIPAERIHVTGNTVVDALFHILKTTRAPAPSVPSGAPYVLMTCHRREAFGSAIRGIFQTVRNFARRHPELYIWYPVHPNPNVTAPTHEILDGQRNILLTEPMDYVTFLHAMKGCLLLLTDSGGIQEEAATLGKPVLVLRDVTERPEGVEAGVSLLVGTRPGRIAQALEMVVTDSQARARMSLGRQVYGDGRATERIASILTATS